MAISSEVQIANLALDYLGAENITLLTDMNSVSNNFDLVRDSVLEDRDWTFSMKRVLLSSPDSTAPAFGYANRFAIPSDCLRVVEVNENKYDWIKEGNFILTNLSEIQVLYVKREEDVSKFTAGFIHVFALRLAAALAIPITNSAEFAGNLLQMYQIALMDASGNDGRQGTHKPVNRNVSLKRNGLLSSNIAGPTV